MANKIIQQLMEKEVDRKEFLAHLGAGALAVIGVSGILKNLGELGLGHPAQKNGYGSSTYGGVSKRP